MVACLIYVFACLQTSGEIVRAFNFILFAAGVHGLPLAAVGRRRLPRRRRSHAEPHIPPGWACMCVCRPLLIFDIDFIWFITGFIIIFFPKN